MDVTALTLNTSPEEINKAIRDTMVGTLNISVVSINKGEIKAIMPVCKQTIRPGGMLHGGANLALAETIAGLGSMLLVNLTDFDVVGIQVNGNHTGSVTEGIVYATASIIHQGRQTHIWNVDIKSESGKLISTARITNMIVKKNG